MDLSAVHESPAPSSNASPTHRLSMHPGLRIPLAATGGFVSGLVLGISHGSQTTALRFRAENAHRLPTTKKGWYLYHKSKNYNMMLGGVKEGLRMGTRLAFWTGAFFGVEESIDSLRSGKKDFLSTVVAGLTMAGAFSAWHRLPPATAARMAKTGLLGGLVLGLGQDVVGLMRGRRIAYVDFLFGTSQRDDGSLKVAI